MEYDENFLKIITKFLFYDFENDDFLIRNIFINQILSKITSKFGFISKKKSIIYNYPTNIDIYYEVDKNKKNYTIMLPINIFDFNNMISFFIIIDSNNNETYHKINNL